jgi:cytidylate kinase
MKTRNGDLMLRYCARMADIAARFDDVLRRRMDEASSDRGAALLMGSLTAKIEHAFRQAEDLRVWLEAQRVLGRV